MNTPTQIPPSAPAPTPTVDVLYKSIRAALEAGLEVSLRPKKGKKVTLTVSEAKNGCVNGCNVDLSPFEWALVGDGIAERINEAVRILKP